MSIDISNEEGVATIRMAGKPANTLSWSVLMELEAALSELRSDQNLRVVVVRGEGANFCLGADLRDPELMQRFPTPQGVRDIAQLGFRVFEHYANLPVPIVCAAQGWAVGGGFGLFGLADFRLATTKTEIALPEVNRGLYVAWGLIHRLRPRVDPDAFRRMLLLGEAISVETLGAHFATLCDEDDLSNQSEKLVTALLEKPATASRTITQSLREADAYQAPNIDDDAQRFLQAAHSAECAEAMMRWMENR